jgi:hypothetical protein
MFGSLRGLPGDYLTDPRMMMAQRLMNQGIDTSPVQHWTQGLGRLAQALAGSYMMNKSMGDADAASQAMMQGATAKPWVNPDTGQASDAQAGGYPGALAALGRLQGNPFAARLARDMMVQKIAADQSLVNAKELRASPQWEGNPQLVREYQFAKTDQGGGFRGSFADYVNQVKASSQGPTAPMQNFGYRNELVKKFGENSPEVARFDTYVRQNTWLDIGGSRVLPDPSRPGVLKAEIPKTVPPEQQPKLKGQQEEAKAIGEETGRRAVQASPAAAKLQIQINPLDRMSETVDSVLNSPSLDQITGAWSVVPIIPGTQRADAVAKFDNLKSQIAQNVMQMYRDMSQTGGAVGQVSNFEQNMFMNNLAALDRAQTPAEMRKELQRIKTFVAGSKERLQSAYEMTYGRSPEPPAAQAPDRPPTGKIKFLGFE